VKWFVRLLLRQELIAMIQTLTQSQGRRLILQPTEVTVALIITAAEGMTLVLQIALAQHVLFQVKHPIIVTLFMQHVVIMHILPAAELRGRLDLLVLLHNTTIMDVFASHKDAGVVVLALILDIQLDILAVAEPLKHVLVANLCLKRN